MNLEPDGIQQNGIQHNLQNFLDIYHANVQRPWSYVNLPLEPTKDCLLSGYSSPLPDQPSTSSRGFDPLLSEVPTPKDNNYVVSEETTNNNSTEFSNENYSLPDNYINEYGMSDNYDLYISEAFTDYIDRPQQDSGTDMNPNWVKKFDRAVLDNTEISLNDNNDQDIFIFGSKAANLPMTSKVETELPNVIQHNVNITHNEHSSNNYSAWPDRYDENLTETDFTEGLSPDDQWYNQLGDLEDPEDHSPTKYDISEEDAQSLLVCPNSILPVDIKLENPLGRKLEKYDEANSTDFSFTTQQLARFVAMDHDYISPFFLGNKGKPLAKVPRNRQVPDESFEEEEEQSNHSKRKRTLSDDERDGDYVPGKPPAKRKPGRPKSTVARKTANPRNTRSRVTVSRPTVQAAKSRRVSTVPLDKREQHNQAERDRRGMLKFNTSQIEQRVAKIDADLFRLTQEALQRHKTNCADSQIENNFVKAVQDNIKVLIGRGSVPSHTKSKGGKNKFSKMVVLLGATYIYKHLKEQYSNTLHTLHRTKKNANLFKKSRKTNRAVCLQ